ncbi:MAG: hypothetical protein J6B57_00010 [Oscillospiraceae bacterium]|nr:hypothetical protein [Oscillospiraceae bacterium]
MNDYRIKAMKLQNFCGIQSLEITPDGADISVYGDNATGKTTIANAFAWLFTGKNASGTADFDPAPLDSSNAKIHNLETSVTARFTDGTEYRRVLTEVWTKKRGEVTAQLTGTKTAYYKDDVPLKEKEFNADVDSLFGGAEKFRMLTAVGYFPAVMDWKARRKLLLEMCGDVRDEDVIASTPEISELPGLLGGHSVDDFLKVAKSRKTALKKELDTIPARITENENAASGTPAADEIPAVEAEISALEKQEKDIAAKISAYNTPSAADERRNALRQELEKRRTEYLSEHNRRVGAYNIRLSELTERRDELYSERSPLLVKKTSLPRQIDEMKKLNQQLHDRCDEIRAREYIDGDTCPRCGQKLPPEQAEKAIAEFNQRKSEELSAIVAKAKTTCHRDMISALESEFETVTASVSALDEKFKAVEEEIEALRNSKPVSAFESTAEYAEITAQIAAVKDDGETQIPTDLLDSQKDIADKLAAAKEKLYKARAAQDIRRRIAELEAQKKSLEAEYAGCEKGEYLCEQFIRAKVSMLDERINSQFRTLKFKLFHEQQNGGLQEICKVLIPCESGLVEYENANSAARINAGIEIVNVLGEYFGTRLPVFCDNAESVTALTPSDGQAVRLIVSEADKSLRFEA